ncbi:ABC transporter permease [Sporosarcina sp. A2]|uniref:ABC transporter permease n=1 Tax=Sporosarcina sp. A2 TaxID=3393449 RepID=UPI003D797B69
MLATQLKYDLLMFFREIFFVIFIVILPPASYVFMGQLYGEWSYNGGLSYAETYTPSFILLIAFGIIFFAFGFDQVENRTTGIEKRITITPVPKSILLLSAIVKSVILTSLGFFLICLIGAAVYKLNFHLVNFIAAYTFFIFMNAVLLVIASAIYSFFKTQNSALIFSIVIFQVVMITGGFAIPIELMPKFVHTIANFNMMSHMNQLFVSIWNGQLAWTSETMISSGFIALIFLISLVVLRLRQEK